MAEKDKIVKENGTGSKEAKNDKRKRITIKVLKWAAGIAVGAFCFFITFMSLLVWLLTPERLTPIIEAVGSEYLKAEVKLDRAELKFWSTFPKLEVDIKNLQVISHSLDTLTAEQRSQLPANADSLLSVKRFSGGVNVLKLMTGKIEIRDVDLVRPVLNLVAYDGSISNFDIFPPKEEKKKKETKIPDLSINRFTLLEGAPVSYFSLKDSIDVKVNLNKIGLADDGQPCYKLDFKAATSADMLPIVKIKELPLAINGDICWTPREPLVLELKDFLIGVGPLRTFTDTRFNFDRDFIVDKFNMRVQQVKIADLVNSIPQPFRAMVPDFTTNLSVKANVSLTRPFVASRNLLPSLRVDVEVPDGNLHFNEYGLSNVGMELGLTLDGSDLDNSVIEMKRLVASGRGFSVNLNCTVSNPLTDPRAKGSFVGKVDFADLPPALLSKVPGTVKGKFEGLFNFDFRKSYLSSKDFHRMQLDGDLSLRNLNASLMGGMAGAYCRNLDIKFGTNDSFVKNDLNADSLLTASLRVDTIYVGALDMEFQGKDLLVGAGCRNNFTLADPSHIRPFGAVFKAAGLKFDLQSDSMSVNLKNIVCHASLQRYVDDSRLPLLSVTLDAARARYRSPDMRVNFRDTKFDFSCHPRTRPEMSVRMAEKFDSLRMLYPKLRPDSIYSLARIEARKARNAEAKRKQAEENGNIDFDLDKSTRNFLRWIDFSAHLSTRRARVFTPYFPLRNSVKELNLSITPDSVMLRHSRFQVGHSDFLVDGTISNVSNALLSRRNPLRMKLEVFSDTININEITQAAFAGGAYADKKARGEALYFSDSDDDEVLQKNLEKVSDSGSKGPLLIPKNIEAAFLIKADNVLFSDILLDDFVGELLMFDGALNLHEISATTDAGGISLSALYEAPDRDDLSFAIGLDIKRLDLDKFLNLIPALDSLMPVLHNFKGIIDAQLAASARVDPEMNLVIPSIDAVLQMRGDSLVFLDNKTFKKIARWMLFKHKDRNLVDSMNVQVAIQNSMIELYPFIFQMDRYRLGVMGSNDLAMNLNYHVSVLKSPIPFKFGINIKGTPEKLKIRLGGAKFKENMVVDRIAIADTTRINLINQIDKVFKRGISRARLGKISVPRPGNDDILNMPEESDTISRADSLIFIQEGLIIPPDSTMLTPVNPWKEQ